MCNFEFSVEVTKEEIYNCMFVPGEYVKRDGKYYIPNIPGFRDGYICPCSLPPSAPMIIDMSDEYNYMKDPNYTGYDQYHNGGRPCGIGRLTQGGVAKSGKAADCNPVIAGSNPAAASNKEKEK